MARVPHLLPLAASALLALCIIFQTTHVEAAGRPPPKVNINKCCRIGEYLDRTKTCVAGSSEKWVPMIFMINKKAYYMPRGEHPKFFNVTENAKPSRCLDTESELYNKNIVIFSNGSLYLSEQSLVIAPEDYCADRESAIVCHQQIQGMDSLRAAKKLSKIRKCCGPHAAYDEVNKTCLYYNDPDHSLYRADVVNSSEVSIVYGFPECPSVQYAIAGKFAREQLDIETGRLTLNSEKVFAPAEYCLEHTVTADSHKTSSTFVSIFSCSHHFAVSDPVAESVPASNYDARSVVFAVGLFISVIFLLATLIAGFLVPSNHHLLHWRCQIYYVFCLLIGDLLLAITQISGSSIAGTACVVMAICMHFFFLAAFFWLNTMCLNIWWTFRDFRPTSLEKNQETIRLRMYKLYAWGVPLHIVAIGAILDQVPDPGNHIIKPRFGEAKCWFFGDTEILIYFFGPIGVLLFINFLLFASTARQLTCGLWKRDDVKSTTERTALGKVCLKLVIVMGVTWVADIISWLVGGPESVWYVTDLINALQGVFIFIVVGCQPQVWSAIKRICSSKSRREATNTTNAQQHSSSSHGLPSIGDTVTNNSLMNTTTTTKMPMETVC